MAEPTRFELSVPGVGTVTAYRWDARATGRPLVLHPELLAQMMIGVHTHLVHLIHQGLVESTSEVIDAAVGFCIHGISGRTS